MPVPNKRVLSFIAAVLLYAFFYAQTYGPASTSQSSHYTQEAWQEPISATAPTSLFPEDTDPIEAISGTSETSATESNQEEEPKWYFQDDLTFANPDFNIRKLKQYNPHNYEGPGHDTFATYLATRNSTLQDPYFQAAQQLAYRLLWDPRSRSERYPFTVFVAPFIPQEQRDLLSAAGALVRELELVEGYTPVPGFGRWRDLFSKLNLWAQTDFRRIAFLDVDAFPVQNIDQIFDIAEPQKCRPELLSPEDAAYLDEICDYYFSGVSVGSPDQINVGVVVLSPNEAMHQRLMRESLHPENYDNTMAEQAFLNYAFRPDGPFPLSVIGREWNGFFPQFAEAEWLKVIHEKLWAIQRTGEEPLQWLKDYFGDTWADMLKLYESRRFENMRAADGTII